MQVDAAMLRQRKHPVGNDAAIRDHGNRIGSDVLQLRAQCFVVANLLRLLDRDAMLLRPLLYRRREHLHAASAGAVRLGEHQWHFVASRNQCRERRHGELRRTAEHHTQWGYHSPARCILRILRSIRSRLSAETRWKNNTPCRWSISC